MKIIIKKSDDTIEKEVIVDTNKTILKQIEEAGIEMQSACHTGIC
jgi:ferredoxin